MIRRLVLLVAGLGSFLGVLTVPLAAPADAGPVINVVSPANTGLLGACATVTALDQKVCVYA